MANPRFVPSLESVRGLAALTVCLFHAADSLFQGGMVLSEKNVFRMFLNGHGAIVLFFVLSGFVLRRSLQKASSTALDYVIARAFRLFPIIFVSIAIFVAIAWLVHDREPQLSVVLRNAFLIEFTVNNALWTLQVEMYGSLIVLAAYLLERRWGVRIVVALLAALLPLSFTGHRWAIGPGSPGMFYTFLLGYLIAVLPPPRFKRPWRAVATLGVALLAFYGVHVYGYVLMPWHLLVTALSAAAIIRVLSSERYCNSLQWAPVRLLGTVSYSFYVFHPLGLQVQNGLSVPIGSLSLPLWLATTVMLALPAIVTIIIAVPMYVLIERTGISLGRAIVSQRHHARSELPQTPIG